MIQWQRTLMIRDRELWWSETCSVANIPKTAFISKYGLFEYTTIPFGLCNAPAMFQRIMHYALSGLQYLTCLIYLDDVITFGKTLEETIVGLSEDLEHFRKDNLKLKGEKCYLFCPEVTFLGHVITREGVRPDPNNITKVQQWSPPADVSGLRQFLGLATYYRRFIKDFVKHADPLTKLTRKDTPFRWSLEAQESFAALKQALIGPYIMAYPLENGQYILDTDACEVSDWCCSDTDLEQCIHMPVQ